LRDLIGGGLEQAASLWPDIERAYRWVHQAVHILNNHEDEDAAMGQRRFNAMLGAMARHRSYAQSIGGIVGHCRQLCFQALDAHQPFVPAVLQLSRHQPIGGIDRGKLRPDI